MLRADVARREGGALKRRVLKKQVARRWRALRISLKHKRDRPGYSVRLAEAKAYLAIRASRRRDTYSIYPMPYPLVDGDDEFEGFVLCEGTEVASYHEPYLTLKGVW